MPFKVILGDITELNCDAIVNFLYENGVPSNRSNVCKAILRRLGQPGDSEYDQYVHHIDSLDLKPGLESDVCSVKGLFVPRIINAVVPKKESDQARYDGVYVRLMHSFSAVYRAARKRGLKSIAVPPLGSGTVCHYSPSDSLKAAQTALRESGVASVLDVTYVMLYRSENFEAMMASLTKDKTEQGEGNGIRPSVFPDYFSCRSTNERIATYVKARYQIDNYLQNDELKDRVLAFVYDASAANMASNQRKLNDPLQTISARTAWLFACALRMNMNEFMEFYRAISPNPPMSETERGLFCASINWGLTDDTEALEAAYLAVMGKPLFKKK
jgi:O-acetyl-ADP-ribose deacetylase (regulator of RNase III)